MAGSYKDLLPHNWSKVVKNDKGTLVEVYKNEKTGHMINSKEDFDRYTKFVVKTLASLRNMGSSVPKKELEKHGEHASDPATIEDPKGQQEAFDAERVMSGRFAGPSSSVENLVSDTSETKAVRRARVVSRKK